MSDLLAGPIVRRSDEKRICIWAATRSDRDFEGKLYLVDLRRPRGKEIDRDHVLSDSRARKIQLGQNLFVHLIELVPHAEEEEEGEGEGKAEGDDKSEDSADASGESASTGPEGDAAPKAFPRGQILAYDLTANGISLWENPDLAVGNLALPTVLLQRPRGALIALTSSCRKLHGRGEDALMRAASYLQEWALVPHKRPVALFLMGDQIYADDVAGALLAHIKELGDEVCQHRELIPGIGTPPFAIPLGKRDPLSFSETLRNKTGFTSTAAANHLMAFSEWAAMYILAWNGEEWPKPNRWKTTDGVMDLERARVALMAVRRLLANVPTYMIFDDHEVTDDWNLTDAWTQEVYSQKPAGRRIVANALAAFWAFQAWGNNPDAALDGKLAAVLTAHVWPGAALSRDEERKRADAFERAFLEKADWMFVTPTSPPAIFLDTRTRRGPGELSDGPAHKRAPRLINDGGWRYVDKIISDSEIKAGEPMVLIAPGPIYNLDAIEWAQSAAARISRVLGGTLYDRYVQEVQKLFRRLINSEKDEPWIEIEHLFQDLDVEAWRSNRRNMVDVFKFLVRHRPSMCVVLSGDVHYASSGAGTVSSSDGKRIPVAQFTSSASKNRPPDGLTRLAELARPSLSLDWWVTGDKIEYLSVPWAPSLLKALTGKVLSGTSATPDFSERVLMESRLTRDIQLNEVERADYETRSNVGILTVGRDFVGHTLLIEPGGSAMTAYYGLNNWPYLSK